MNNAQTNAHVMKNTPGQFSLIKHSLLSGEGGSAFTNSLPSLPPHVNGCLSNNGTVTLNRSDDFTLATRITGTGGLIKGLAGNAESMLATR